MSSKSLLYFFCLCIFATSSSGKAEDENSCKGKSGGSLQLKLNERKKNLEDLMQSSIQLIQALSESEKMAKRNYDISSSISYGLIGAGVTGGASGAFTTVISGGMASLSLRLSAYVAGNTLRTNTVGIGSALLKGAVVGAGGRAWYLYDGKENKIDVRALNYSYQQVKPSYFNPYEPFFTESRFELTALQKKMADDKGASGLFNWNNQRDLNKARLDSINNFFMLQLLALEYEAIKKSLTYLSANCDSERILLDMDVSAEKKKIFESYAQLKEVDLAVAFGNLRETHRSTAPVAR